MEVRERPPIREVLYLRKPAGKLADVAASARLPSGAPRPLHEPRAARGHTLDDASRTPA
ncbi:MAG: hypothetical protein ABWK01_01445 [Infirmifilum sp.]